MTVRKKPRAASAGAGDDFSLLTAEDIYLFNEGSHLRLYDKLGCHLTTVDGREGAYFAVWAPDAEYVSVIGDFNGWDKGAHRLRPKADSGIWEGFVEGLGRGCVYKYHVASRYMGYHADKADPYALFAEEPPTHRIGHLGPRLCLAGRGLDGFEARAQLAQVAAGGVRGAPRGRGGGSRRRGTGR